MKIIKGLILTLLTSVIMCKDSLQTYAVQTHNTIRSKYKQAAVKWNSDLAKQAQSWSDHMAKTGLFVHDKNRPAGVGENIVYLTDGRSVDDKNLWADLFGSWLAEEKYTNVKLKYPSCCITNKDCGHFTAMIWTGTRTKEIGCAIASATPKKKGAYYRKLLTCRYNKSGNIIGQKPF